MTAKSTRTTQPNQLLFDWTFFQSVSPPSPDIDYTRSDARAFIAPTGIAAGMRNQNRQPRCQSPSLSEIRTSCRCCRGIFAHRFRSRRRRRFLNGTLQPEDAEPENLASLHEEHARHVLALLHDLDAVMDARRSGVDPRTGKAPRTAKQREALEKLFKEEPSRLEREFDTLIDVYEEVFGAVAADAFRKAIRAWHAGVEVIGEAPPTPRPLSESIDAGIFGVEEDGSPVNPDGDGSCRDHRVCCGRLDGRAGAIPSGRRCSRSMRRISGRKPPRRLDRWSRLKPEADDTRSAEYDPGHPWHYYDRGDGADPLPLDAIPARIVTTEQFNVKWPKNAAKRRAMMQQMLTSQMTQLAEDEKRYQRLVDDGVDALSQYDREIAHGGNDDLAWASAVALKYNHISDCARPYPVARGATQQAEGHCSRPASILKTTGIRRREKGQSTRPRGPPGSARDNSAGDRVLKLHLPVYGDRRVPGYAQDAQAVELNGENGYSEAVECGRPQFFPRWLDLMNASKGLLCRERS